MNTIETQRRSRGVNEDEHVAASRPHKGLNHALVASSDTVTKPELVPLGLSAKGFPGTAKKV